MLSQARALLSDSPNGDKVTLLTHDLTRAWPLSDACADVMFGDLVLEHLQTLDFFFSEAARWGGGVRIKEYYSLNFLSLQVPPPRRDPLRL